ncbi:hypothetical protein NPIL_152361 [Nephila pilipes]|uniref:Uncharacterized protein n=1 Tax=Nephila pilipes TaxID=299642 RepID=A0A8X6NZC7_NEPPI|nr:hypothetical protein NPIL_152361 [Nephila pilipes]
MQTLQWKDERFLEEFYFSDESKFNLFGSDGPHYRWRRECRAVASMHVKATVMHGGGGIMVWDTMGLSSIETIFFTKGTKDKMVH